MQKPFRRFLPTKFNNGLPVPNDEFADTLLELEERFGAVSPESQTVAGQWRHEGHVYRDESVYSSMFRIPKKIGRSFVAFKETLKQRFQPRC